MMITYINAFLMQVIIIGMVINVRHDIPYWKQLIAYAAIACVLPISMFFTKYTLKDE